jgi:hypothetical protein
LLLKIELVRTLASHYLFHPNCCTHLHFLEAKVEGIDVLSEQRIEAAQARRGTHDASVQQSRGICSV